MEVVPLSRLLAVEHANAWAVAQSGGRTIGFAEFRRDVAWNAQRLRARGCRRGLLAVKDGYWAAVGLLSLFHAEATVVLPSNLQSADPEAFDADLKIADGFAEPAPKNAERLPELDPERSHIELFTSGSTGAPKRILKSLQEMDAETSAIEQALGRDLPAVPIYGTVPLHHLYGLSFRLFWPLGTRRRLIAPTHEFWENLAAGWTQGAILVTSPAHLMRIPAIPALRLNPSMVLSAGANLPGDAASAAAEQLGCAVTDIFGSTETGVIAHRLRTGPAVRWRLFPGVALRQEDGRMSVRSDHLAGGDWHVTEDLIDLHEDGSLDLLGRADRIVKIEGNRVSLAAIEEGLRASPLIEDAAVVALETEPASLGAALVLTDQGRDELVQLGAFRLGRLLRRRLAETLATGGLPRHWRFVSSLPVSPLGKSRNADLTALFAARLEAPREPALRAQRNLGDRIALDLSIPANLPCLNGHFPKLPVVPGVAQLDWAVMFAARCFGLPVSVAQKFQIKFKRVTSAPCDVTLTLTHRATEGQVAFEYSQGEVVISHGSFAIAPE